jgi:putative toxin-antitoxin system antitoxin component (TIGR02293 family)
MLYQELVKILGIRTKVTRDLDFAETIETGFPQISLERVKSALDLNDIQVSSTLGISQKTMGRIRKDPARRLPPSLSDRLYRIARLIALAIEVLEDGEEARKWLRRPQIGLNNKIPLELMNTEAGAREVEDLLGRIEHGVLS